jgi:hypothetical protein
MIKGITISTGYVNPQYGYNQSSYSGGPSKLFMANTIEVQGGQQLNITVDSNLENDMNWLRSFREKLLTEERLRANNPFVKDLYEQYLTAVKLVLEENANQPT